MNKILRAVQTYLVVSVPFVIAMMVWSSLTPENGSDLTSSFIVRAVREILSWNLMAWFACLILFLISMVIFSSAREMTITRLANLKERDEREQFIVGQAARRTFISILSVSIFIFFLSVLTVQIAKNPASSTVGGKSGTIKIGFNFDFIEKPKPKISKDEIIYFDFQGIPFSKQALILAFLIWQMTTFHIYARSESRLE